MTKEEIQNRLEAAEKQFAGLQDEIKNLKEKLSEVQDDEIPEFPIFNNDIMFAMSTTLRVFGTDKRTCNGKSSDYNAFHAKEYAEAFATKCREIAMMLHCKWYVDRDYVPDWSCQVEPKWEVVFVHESNEYRACNVYTVERDNVYFSSLESANKAAAWMNAHAKKVKQNDN